MSQRHTVSYLSKILASRDAKPKHRFGQNFLIDLNLIELVVRTAQLTPRDVVLEVGTGSGSMTAHLAERASAVVSVEIDTQMHAIATEELSQFENVTLFLGDALAGKQNVNPDVLQLINQRRQIVNDSAWKLVANLPYNIATPLIANLLLLPDPPVQMVVTVQLEMAQRVTARPGTKQYSALSSWVQSQCECQIVRKLSPKVFWPRPKVESAILEIKFRPEMRQQITDIHYFHDLVRKLFLHRRKAIGSQLHLALEQGHSSQEIQADLATLDIDPKLRADALTVNQLIQLTNHFAAG